MDKLAVVINGAGGVGKDTLCEMVMKRYKAINVSSITPIKEIASNYGWHGEKDEKARRFLSELKQIFIEYNDLPNTYLLNEYEKFIKGDNDIMFVHIREGDQINKFINGINGKYATLLITNSRQKSIYGNDSDDSVHNYDYQYYYDNILPIKEAESDFLSYFSKILQDYA